MAPGSTFASSALKLLKEKIAQTRVAEQLTKLTKARFVSLSVMRIGVFPKFHHLRWPLAAGRAEISSEIDETEREAIATELGGVPEIYASTFAQLQAHAPPDVPLERWHQFINDAGIFLNHWGHDTERLGWRADELFGLDPRAP
jgi:hypothetical protein